MTQESKTNNIEKRKRTELESYEVTQILSLNLNCPIKKIRRSGDLNSNFELLYILFKRERESALPFTLRERETFEPTYFEKGLFLFFYKFSPF